MPIRQYHTPQFYLGQRVTCLWRGEVVICGMTSAPIPWPIAKRGRARSLVLYRDLARAIRTEANVDVCRLFGVTTQTVSKWRKALDVDSMTLGTRKLRVATGTDPTGVAARAEGLRAMPAEAKAARAAKIAAAKRGTPRPKHVQRLLRMMGRAKRRHVGGGSQGSAGRGRKPGSAAS